MYKGLATFGGLLLSGGSLLSGFISSHKFLTLLSGGRYFRNFTGDMSTDTWQEDID